MNEVGVSVASALPIHLTAGLAVHIGGLSASRLESTPTAFFGAVALTSPLNHRPVRGADSIGAFYTRVRDQWDGAVWEVNSYLALVTHPWALERV